MELLVIGVIFGAIFVQSIAGFGSALLAMPLLAQLLGIQTAAPMFALSALVTEILMIIRYRTTFNWMAVWRLMIGAVVGIPLGAIITRAINEQITLFLLGCVTLGYALYSLAGWRIPGLQDKRWAFGAGLVSGLLTGAYNIGGPPYVIYGTSQGWTPIEFKTNLQAAFLVNSFTVIGVHFANHAITSTVIRLFALTIPAVVLALLIGFRLERFISPILFRKGVLALLVLVGLSLLF